MLEDFENMSSEEQEHAISYMEEFLEAVSIGNGDYYEENGSILIE